MPDGCCATDWLLFVDAQNKGSGLSVLFSHHQFRRMSMEQLKFVYLPAILLTCPEE